PFAAMEFARADDLGATGPLLLPGRGAASDQRGGGRRPVFRAPGILAADRGGGALPVPGLQRHHQPTTASRSAPSRAGPSAPERESGFPVLTGLWPLRNRPAG